MKMSKISEEGYLFIHSGILEKDQIETCFFSSIKYLSENYDKSFEKCKIEINVVKNKKGEKYGHTYAWVSDKRVFYALIGKNFDSSELVEYILDENWKPPDTNYEDAFSSSSGNWAEEEEIEDSYEQPRIKKKLEPLVTLPAIKYTEEQIKEINYESEYGFLEVFEIKLTKKPGKTNTLFSNNIPAWVTEDIIKNYFNKFSKDTATYCDKNKTKNKTKNYTYPLVKIKSKNDNTRYCTVVFSPRFPNTSSFLINITKRVIFKKENNSDIVFFSQSKNKLE